MTENDEQKVTIDGAEYLFDELSEQAKTRLAYTIH